MVLFSSSLFFTQKKTKTTNHFQQLNCGHSVETNSTMNQSPSSPITASNTVQRDFTPIHCFRQSVDNAVLFLFAEGGKTIVCNCLSSFETTNIQKIELHLKTYHKHAQVNQDELHSFVNQCDNMAATSFLQYVPMDITNIFQMKEGEASVLDEATWCLHCGCCYGNSKSVSRCKCVQSALAVVSAVVCGKTRRFSPIPITFPQDEIQQLKTLIDRRVYRIAEPKTLQVIELEAEVGVLRAALKASTQQSRVVLFTADKFDAFANHSLSSIKLNTEEEHILTLLKMNKTTQQELNNLYALANQKHRELDMSTVSALHKLNAMLETLSVVNQADLFAVSSGGNREGMGGAVKEVTNRTLETYVQFSLIKVIRIFYHSNVGGFKTRVDDIVAQSMVEPFDLHRQLEPIILQVVYDELINVADSVVLAQRVKLLGGLFLRVGNTDFQGEVEDEEDDFDNDVSSSEEEEDNNDRGHGFNLVGENANVVDSVKAGRICAGLRFCFNAVLAGAFRFQDVEREFGVFVLGHAAREMMRLVNKWLSDCRKLQNTKTVEKNAVAFESNVFVTRYDRLTLDDFRAAEMNCRIRLFHLFETELGRFVSWGECETVMRALLFEQVNEADWSISLVNNEISLLGNGFNRVARCVEEAMLENQERVVFLAQQLKVVLGAWIHLTSTCLLRGPALFNLHASVNNASLGNVNVQTGGMFGSYSYMEVSGFSSKHRGKEEIHGVLTPRVSKIAALVFALFPKVFVDGFAKTWVENVQDTTQRELYFNHFQQLIFRQTSLLELNCTVEQLQTPFGELTWEERNNLLKQQSLRKFECDLTLILQEVFNLSTMSLGLIRRLMSNFNNQAFNLLKHERQAGLFAPFHATLVDQTLENVATLIEAGNVNSLGDGAGHTQQTFQKHYAAHGQGTRLNIYLFNQSSALAKTKLAIFRDFSGLENGNGSLLQVWRQSKLPLPVMGDLIEEIQELVSERGRVQLTKEQQILVASSIENRDIVCRLQCGSGKTFVNLLCASVYQAGVFVFLSPTRALQQSVLQECAKLGICCELYVAGAHQFVSATCWNETGPIRVVAVVFDSSVSHGFLSWVGAMSKRNLINRLVIDEAHLIFESATYRPSVS